jgi:hypothetical protein
MKINPSYLYAVAEMQAHLAADGWNTDDAMVYKAAEGPMLIEEVVRNAIKKMLAAKARYERVRRCH